MLTIGELASQTGASVRSLRHYEQCGLLVSTRRDNGYRVFAPSAVDYVQRIRILLRNGFTIEQIRPVASMLPPLPQDMRSLCAHVIAMYDSKLGELDERIAELQQLRDRAADRLAFLREQRRQGGPTPD
jgi:DNA-binding transcriptional MerR regulator